MKKIPAISDFDFLRKRVLLRLDLDINKVEINDRRIVASIPTLDYLKDKAISITIIAHRGRPDGKVDPTLSLKEFQPFFDKWGAKVEENLRFDPGEEKNEAGFANKLSVLGDVFVNEAFASSHREHASIVGVSKLLPTFFGFHFIDEINNLRKVIEDPKRPIVSILSGVKKDKLVYVEGLSTISDKLLIAGRLPDFLGDNTKSVRSIKDSEKTVVANLVMDKEDITINSIERFEEEIAKAKTIILSGPIGKYEDEGHSQGTERVFTAVSKSNAFKIAGGGDTENAISKYLLTEKFDWISVGGGAMLTFLTSKSLPAIDALLE